MKIHHNLKQRGTTLVVAMMVLLVLMVTVGVAFEYTSTVSRNVQRSNVLLSGKSVAEGAIDIAFGYWREACRAQTNLVLKTNDLDAIPTPSPGQFPSVPSFTVKRGRSTDPNANETDTTKIISNYKIVAVDPQFNDLGDPNNSPPPGIGMSANAITYNYIAAADVTMPALRGSITTKVRRVFQKQQLSPWNYAIFYADPLEIHPGPNLTITGWVHTNSNLYTGHSSLTFADKVTYGADWSIGFMPGDSSHSADTPASPNYPTNLPPATDVQHQPFGLDSTRIFSSSDANPNNDSWHELIDPPVSGYTDPLAGSRYYDQAAFKISIAADDSVTVRKANGNVISNSSGGQDKINYNAIMSAITTGGSIQDNRETSTMRTTTIDVASLVTSLTTSNAAVKLKNWNGVLYVTATGPSGTKPAVKLINGTVLPAGGLTVASQTPVYIQGDYNTGALNPPSNSGDPTTPQVTGYNRQPSAVVADAVTILSNSWADTNSFAGLSSRVASNTTVNTAIVSGIVASAGGNYSGGAENFPRFLEDWTGKSFTYYGSMVELFQSKTANGNWRYGGTVYNAPVRKWYFDNNFKINTPPGSLMIISYLKGRWYTQ